MECCVRSCVVRLFPFIFGSCYCCLPLPPIYPCSLILRHGVHPSLSLPFNPFYFLFTFFSFIPRFSCQPEVDQIFLSAVSFYLLRMKDISFLVIPFLFRKKRSKALTGRPKESPWSFHDFFYACLMFPSCSDFSSMSLLSHLKSMPFLV